MGRTSKFSFPMPGRRHSIFKENAPPPPASPAPNRGRSKAQRILGTDNDLNIDYSPVLEEYSWRHHDSRSSGMSISISESTQSTNENGSLHESEAEQWDKESGIFPSSNILHGRPSSTILGHQHGEERGTMISNASARLRHNDSSSTLKSYYDRSKSPLSISQQTSASSTRDLALRKGCPPVLPRSPLLQVEPIQFESSFPDVNSYSKQQHIIPEKMRKKPARLDLSMLFPRSRRHADKIAADSMSPNASPSSISTNISQNSSQPLGTSRRKLRKAPSKESMKSQHNSIRTTRSYDPQMHQTHGSSAHMYDHYEDLPVRTSHMDRIPEASVPQRLAARAKKDGYAHSKLDASTESSSLSERTRAFSDREPFSWKSVRSSMMASPYDVSSAASISSRNTRTSRHTAASVMSQSDLQDKSVLSLSSDSEGDLSESEAVRFPRARSKIDSISQASSERTAHRPTESRRQSSGKSGSSAARAQGTRNGIAKETPFLTIPETASRSARSSERVYQPSQTENYAPHQQKQYRVSVQKEKRTSRQPSSIKSGRSLLQPTPPLSPTSIEVRHVPEPESRYMAVTKQEEALLEALRQKRARMREEIIEEHETRKSPSPPRIPERSTSRYSTASTVNTVGGTSGQERVLLYLDTPLSTTHTIDTSEPSPDLSDFLSFGSDEFDPKK